MTTISLKEIQEKRQKYIDHFKVGDDIVFLAAGGMWSNLYTLSGKIVKVHDDPLWTFECSVDRKDLIQDVSGFVRDDGLIRPVVHGSMLIKESDLSIEDLKKVNRGKPKTKETIDLEAIFTADKITHKLLNLEDLNILFDPRDISGEGWDEPDSSNPKYNIDLIEQKYKKEYYESTASTLYFMRYIYYLVSAGRMKTAQDLFFDNVNKFGSYLKTYQQLHIPIASLYLNSGETEITRKIIDLIPENDKPKLGGCKEILYILLALERKIDSKNYDWPTTLLESNRFIKNYLFPKK